MTTFLVTFGIFLGFITLMSVGYLIQKKVVKGSCGGLDAMGIDKVCSCPEPCDARKRREAKAAARAEKVASWEKDRIA